MGYHDPVLVGECIKGLNMNPAGIYVDVTFGGGGHAREILKHLTTGRLIAFDQDPDAATNTIDDERFMLVKQNFRFLKNFLKLYKAVPVNGVLADLGVSSHQINLAERGFSTRYDAELDMRMSRKGKLTAKELINDYSNEELFRVFKEYGEVKNTGKLVKTIVEARKAGKISTVFQLKEAIADCAPKGRENKYFAKVFQAIRIEVNDELGALKELLQQCNDVVVKGGRLVVISYHSLEDRLVKNFMRSGKFSGEIEKDFYGNPIRPFKPVHRKVIVPSEEEVKQNIRSRSAKLRVAEKL